MHPLIGQIGHQYMVGDTLEESINELVQSSRSRKGVLFETLSVLDLSSEKEGCKGNLLLFLKLKNKEEFLH